MDEYGTINEGGEQLRLAERTVYEIVRTGRPPGATKGGGSWRINRRVLDQWCAAGGEVPASAQAQMGNR